MSNTEKLVARFWQSMLERYGTRWAQTYGTEPTTAWRDCLDAYTPRDIAKAFDMLDAKDHTRQHPPTEPEFRALLKSVGRNTPRAGDDPNELRRGYWRSTVIAAVARALGHSPETLAPLVAANKDSLGRAMRDLLDEVDENELRTGQRTKGHEQMVFEGASRIAVAFNQLRAAQ